MTDDLVAEQNVFLLRPGTDVVDDERGARRRLRSETMPMCVTPLPRSQATTSPGWKSAGFWLASTDQPFR